MFDDLKNRLKSLDIETTGINFEEDKIWSIGLTSSSHPEQFINPTDGLAGEPLRQNMGSKDYFQKQQAEKGSFSSLLNAVDKKEDIKVDEAVRNVFKNIDKSSVILIQNVNFENRFVGEVLKGLPKDLQKAKDSMMYNSIKSTDPGRILYTPPQVTSLRNQADYEHRRFLKGHGSFDTAADLYSQMMGEYKRHFSMQGKGAFTVDLMDVTKATYAAAAQKGFLNKKNINTGLSVEFLSQALLGEEEAHTALDDANRQVRLFSRLMGIQREVEAGNVSQKTLKDLSKMKAAQPYESARSFVSALRNSLEEINTHGSTRLFDSSYSQLRNMSGVKADIVDSSGKKHHIVSPSYAQSYTTSSAEEAMQHHRGRYLNSGMKGIDSAAFVSSLSDSNLTNSDRIRIINDEEKRLKEMYVREMKDSKSLSKMEKLDRSIDQAKNVGVSIKEKISKLSTKQKGLGLAAMAGLGLAAAASTDKEEVDEMREMSKQKTQQSSLNNAFKSYSSPTVYHGSGFADWNNRTQHHQY